MFEKLIPYDVAHLILGEYLKYYHQFKRVTKRAKVRFELRDWSGIQDESAGRIELYRDKVSETVQKVREFLGERSFDKSIWSEVKQMYFEDILNFNTRNVAETFYNSVLRHYFKGISADPDFMFVHSTGTYREFKSTHPIYYTLYLNESLHASVSQIFSLYSFDAPYQDLDRDIQYMVEVLEKKLKQRKSTGRILRLELLKSVFFRNKGAYIVGRLFLSHEEFMPFVIPLLHEENGIFVDALLLSVNAVSSIFSYHRSYFLVDVDIVSEMVDFLRSIIPFKSLGELYTSIGFEKHGKTVFYRDFLSHLEKSKDKFVDAPGIKGMVMLVFHLPSYNMVFKVIKDYFEPPKNVTEQIVKEKYALVHRHDRVGRMTDSHMFENLVFDRDRFSEELLAEMQKYAKSKIILTDKTVEIKHLYVEKRLIPLNMYLDKANLQQAEEVINEYGKAIKEMAAANIFPGDMLLKNFGVTRLKRVVFYDYDEIGFLTDYNFRRIPEPKNEYEEMSAEPFYHVGPDDIFPEEFPRFLIGNVAMREIFVRLHGDLFDVDFWKETQEQLKQGIILDVFPYKIKNRFSHKFRKRRKKGNRRHGDGK